MCYYQFLFKKFAEPLNAMYSDIAWRKGSGDWNLRESGEYFLRVRDFLGREWEVLKCGSGRKSIIRCLKDARASYKPTTLTPTAAGPRRRDTTIIRGGFWRGRRRLRGRRCRGLRPPGAGCFRWGPVDSPRCFRIAGSGGRFDRVRLLSARARRNRRRGG